VHYVLDLTPNPPHGYVCCFSAPFGRIGEQWQRVCGGRLGSGGTD
jgi:hypothetical protein